MDIVIKTKYNVGDIVYGYTEKYGFEKYEIKDIKIQKYSLYYTDLIEYRCSAYSDKNKNNTFTKCDSSFREIELYTYDELI